MVGILEMARIINRQRLNERQKRILAEGSPTFEIKNSSAISAGGIWMTELDVNGSQYQKYLPFDTITIQNNSSQNITVKVGVHTITVLANTSIIKNNLAFRRIEVTNDGSASINANEISIRFQVEPITEDKRLQMELKGSFI